MHFQHDELVEIAYHALPGVRKEQCMINRDQGMFTNQTSNTVVLLVLTYVSVHSTTHALYLSPSFSCAGVAAAAGEFA